jgi:BirA family biotin operon repressor/biotin-[acetyl-CoA-carboxylase] ligase
MLLAQLDREYDALVRGDGGGLESRWQSLLGLSDREVVAETFDGTRLRGRLRECTFAGIEIESPGGTARVAPEQVRALSAAENA